MAHVTRSRLFRNIRAIGGNSPIRYGLCTGQISLPNSCKNRMQTTFSLSAERLHVRVIDTETKVDSYNPGRCSGTVRAKAR